MAFFTKGICANNMVLLQNEVNCIFGVAPAGSVVEMEFRGKRYSAKVNTTADKNSNLDKGAWQDNPNLDRGAGQDNHNLNKGAGAGNGTSSVGGQACGADGEWKIEFNPGKACKGETLMLTCKGEKKIVFKDVAVGEVWLCSGQSNMQLTFDRLRFAYPEEFKKKENSDIRMITIPVQSDFSGEHDMIENPVWDKPSPKTLASMSGTAYFFAKKIQEDLGVPVGIINASQGGIPITAMMNAKSFEGIGDYTARYNKVCEKGFVEKTRIQNQKNADKWNKLITDADVGLKEKWEKIPFGKIETPIRSGDLKKKIGSPMGAASGWSDFEIPGTCDLIKDAGIVWFKKEFTLTEKQLEHLQKKGARIWLGTIRDADTVYINGKQVGITYYLYPPRRYAFDASVLKAGKNTVTIRVQQNAKWGKIHFFLEKPYAITSEDVKMAATVSRNVERKHGYIVPERVNYQSENATSGKIGTPKGVDSTTGFATPAETGTPKGVGGVYIPLSGKWKCKVGCQVKSGAGTVFVEYEPSGLYNAMLAPCFNTAIRGAVWYQGESNTLKFFEYEKLLCNMISLWRAKFKYAAGGLSFVVMQLPNWANDTLPCANPVFSDWALLRETQYNAVQKTKNTAISVTIDAGEWNDLHPEKKLTGGTRTAEQALQLAYGKDYLKPAVIKSAKLSDDKKYFTVKFSSDADLVAYKACGEDVDFDTVTKSVEGFGVLIRGEGEKKSSTLKTGTGDASFVTPEMQGEVRMCEAVLCGKKAVRVMLPDGVKASDVREVRYLWANCPVCVNMYAGGMPVMPGRIKVVNKK